MCRHRVRWIERRRERAWFSFSHAIHEGN
jgi:hypothetical protein